MLLFFCLKTNYRFIEFNHIFNFVIVRWDIAAISSLKIVIHFFYISK